MEKDCFYPPFFYVKELKMRNKLCAASFKGISAYDESASGSEDMEEGSGAENWFNY